MKKLILTIAAVFMGLPALAQLPDPIGATDRLRFEAERLDQAVSLSNLGPQVRNATFSLARQSDNLYRCVVGQINNTVCSQEAVRTQNFFRVAEGLLWNTQQTAPQVHYQYLRTSQAHQQAQASMNSVPSGMLRASGYINRIQFNFQGRGPAAIINSCLNWGQAYGIIQVRELYVNGRLIPLGGIINIRQACQLVANYSIPGL